MLGIRFLSNFLNLKKFKKIPLILNYHQIVYNDKTAFNYPSSHQVSIDNFQSQIKWLSNNFQILPLQKLIHDYKTHKLQNYSAAITFDDGYKETFSVADSFLSDNNIPASFFIIGCTLDKKAPYYDLFFFLKEKGLMQEFMLGLNIPNISSLTHLKKNIKYNPDFPLPHFITYSNNFIHNHDLNLELESKIEAAYLQKTDLENQTNKLFCFGDHSYYHFNMANSENFKLNDNLKSIMDLCNIRADSFINCFSIPFGNQKHFNTKIIKSKLGSYTSILLSPGSNLKKYFDYWDLYASQNILPRYMPLNQPSIL